MKNYSLLLLILFTSSIGFGQANFTKTVINTGYDFEHPFEIFLAPNAPADSAFVNTRSGRIYIVSLNNGGRRELLDIRTSVTFTRSFTGPNVTGIAQDGMFGMALHPQALQGVGKDSLYVAYCYNGTAARRTRIAKYYINPITKMLTGGTTLIQGLPGSNDHNGGRLKIGPDFKLYYSCGDQGANQFGNACITIKSQIDITAGDLSSATYTNYAGHMLRMNLDGSVPTDNPTFSSVKSHVYSKGHRNPQGLAFETNGSGQVVAGAKLYSSEQGAVIDDEVNILQSGNNYGWPHLSGYYDNIFYTYKNWSLSPSGSGTTNCTNYPGECGTATNMTGGSPANPPRAESFFGSSGYVDPIFSQAPNASPDCANWLNRPTVAWSSIEFYNNSGGIPGWNNSLLLPTLKRSSLIRLKLNATNDAIVGDTIEYFRPSGSTGLNRFRDLAISTNGAKLYMITDSVGATSGPSGASGTITDLGKIVMYTYTGTLLTLPQTTPVRPTENTLVKTYPNPVVDKLIIDTRDLGQKPYSLTVKNIYGATTTLIKNVNEVVKEVDVHHLPAGQYIVSLQNKAGATIAIKKIIIAR